MGWILTAVQLIVTVIMGAYFFSQLQKQRHAEPVGRRESAKEMENLRRMRAISL